jgi:hypothetical protein
MKKLFFFSFLFFFVIALKAQSLVLVKGYVTSTEDYCDGARPSEELLEDLAKERPLANKILYVKVGVQNKHSNRLVKKIKTNANGRFEIWLKPGLSYYFVEEWKAKAFTVPKNSKEISWDTSCLRKRYASPDYVLKPSKSNNVLVRINYHKPCYFNPYCGSFSGPLPP